MHEGALHRLIGLFSSALDQLGLDANAKTIEELAVIIHKAMTVQARNYHNLEHVLQLVEPGNPIRTLAALFHDIVYYQVDLGFLPEILEVIGPFIHQDGSRFSLVGPAAESDRLFRLACEAFALPLDTEISPSMGLNEFLSAVVMNKKLGGLVPDVLMLKMDICIEATIPFRGKTSDGRNTFDLVYERMIEINQRWGFEMSSEEIDAAISTAVEMANCDVDSFAESSPAGFLQNTWKLLPEMNIPLRARNVYTIREYREALQRLEMFFKFVDPETVFHHYKGVPTEDVFQGMVTRARHNIGVGQVYLRYKLLTQAILESLAEESGGDAPLSLFMGDIPEESKTERLEDYLPRVEDPPWLNLNPALYELLAVGRQDQPGFDLNISPLTLFVYRTLPPDEIERASALAHEVFAGSLSHWDFLHRLNPEVVRPIARASAKMVVTRAKDLLKYG